MVQLQIIGHLFILGIITSNIIQGYGFSDSLELNEEEDVLSDSPDIINRGSYNVKSTKGGKRVFAGGCIHRPNLPTANPPKLKCSLASGGCVANCPANYKFPNSAPNIKTICVDGEWQIQGNEWNMIPQCEPICMPECQNNGICISPHHCDCPEHFTGPQCQLENKPCLNNPPLVQSSHITCNSKTCTVSCSQHFAFPDGSSITNLRCENGTWQPARKDWVSIPNCEPLCNPPCQNGGTCMPLNYCQCSLDYRGPQCQYSSDACNATKLLANFNGGYYCNGTDNANSCTLYCPTGVEFEFPPAAAYICTYDKGIFEPELIPRCKEDGVRIIPLDISHNTYVHKFNHSWSSQGVFHERYKSDNTGYYNIYHNNGSLNMIKYNTNDYHNTMIYEVRPKPKTCFTWSGKHYKTFDDRIYSFDSDCAHILFRELQDNVFTIVTLNSPGCKTGDHCFRIIRIFIHDKEYTLANDEKNVPIFSNGKRSLPIPAYLPGLRVDKSAHFILVSFDSLGVKLKWDGSLLLQIEASESMWNKTTGLCGTMNDNPNDDFVTKSGNKAGSVAVWADSWRNKYLGEICDDPSTQHACETNNEFFNVTRAKALEFCDELLSDNRFKSCTDTIIVSELIEACSWDYCACKDIDKRKCACDTMDVYTRQCTHKGVVKLTTWRNNETCPISCNNGRVYMPCGPNIELSCLSVTETKSESSECEEGCFCPEGTLEHQGKCVSLKECPCRLRGKLFQPGKSVRKGCNTCTCISGKWTCTQIQCGARCAVIGDPHYTTFDGKHYNFMGKCNYYLMKGENYTIEAENVQCSGTISEVLGFASADVPSCTKSVTINFKDICVKMKQNRQVIVNGDEITKFPTMIGGIRIRIGSSIFLVINLPNGLEIWWDGVSRVYINAPAEFHGHTKGLCGTFTENQKDDFITPDGDVESTAIAFANKWRTNEYCIEESERESKDACELNPQRREMAEEYCSKIHTEIFSDCHWYLDPAEFYEDCLYDMCACDTDIKSCLCPILAAYAEDCAALGMKLSWRSEIDECAIHCSGGQIYQICGNSCTRSCGDISFYQDCKQECIEGCNCPDGQTLDINGECIPIAQCPCMYAGREYKPNHREVRPGNKGQEYCTCIGGIWKCRLATADEIKEYPAITELLSICRASEHLVVTDCEPVEQRTCTNMHVPNEESPAKCTAGCICKSGYILDKPNGVCIKEEDCPCHHGGKSYKEGSVIRNDCNTCTCESTKWKCTDRICAGVCSVWGDSHYKTFDGKMYDFQGICDYVLVKSALSKEESFDVSIQNVPCGTNGVACSKSIKLAIGNGKQREELTLTKEKELPNGPFKRMTIRTAGLFVFVDVPDLGLVLQWDKGTRVYVRLNPQWKGRTVGLCGDYNDNAEDDFKTPSGGISEAHVNLFGDSWKKHSFCPEPQDIQDTCKQHPQRKWWSLRKCNVLKSSVFSLCHSEVEVEPYIRNCIFDTCSCDAGGDCECLCTALAAYAHECNVRGVPIKWRTQELCPLQCNEECSTYSPCISTCQRETCDNLMTIKHGSHLCTEDTCVEGCLFKPCPEDQVYWNNSYTECTPKSTCKPFCAEIDGLIFYEGEKVSGDDCQSCYCSRGKVTCKGERCTSTISTITVPLIEPQKCVDGWSAWINRDLAIKGKKFSDIEPLPDFIDLANENGFAMCDREHIADIKCRSVKDHLSPKDSGLDVECSLERGLYCQSKPSLPCVDFEISVLCRCSQVITHEEIIEFTTVAQKTSEQCDIAHPNSPHLTDCHLFYQCNPELTGFELIEKSCGPDMLYNSETQVCDWPAVVLQTRPECSVERPVEQNSTRTFEWKGNVKYNKTSTSSRKTVSTANVCKDGEIWNKCAIQCSKTCQYYHHVLTIQGYCNESTDCIAACVSKDRLNCPSYKYWRDGMTCVDATDCTCKSHNGTPVAPGAIKKESDCETCQCIKNYYTCDTTLCARNYETTTVIIEPLSTTISEYVTKKYEEITSTLPIEESTILIHSTVTPPGNCDNTNFVPLMQNLRKEISFSASSSKNPILQLENISVNVNQISPESVEFWEPEVNNDDQWLDIKFNKPEPVYSIILQGGVTEDKFVTSYKVLFSEDGHTFSYVLDNKRQPRVFRGPFDKIHSVEQKFYQPIEAKIVRINPLTWHNGIAIRVEVLGCQDRITTATAATVEQSTMKTVIFEKITEPICEDIMGLDNGLMAIEQISVSSSPELIQYLRLSSNNAWYSALDNPHQYVQFDFLEARNLTGITTKGGNDAWTTVYKIFYSNDGRHWNSIMNENNNEKEFLGNYDSENLKTNFFERPLHARFLKLQPIKWHKHVALKVEILGCYLTYPTMSWEISTSTLTTPLFERKCNVCHGVSVLDEEDCKCKDPYWWDGTSCLTKQECPCIVGHVSYAVGSVYEIEDCQECVCTLGGIATCLPKKCDPCQEPELQSVMNELCTCLCKPCPLGMRHCPTSDVCINETMWCNGLQDCPDDEKNCPEIITTPFTIDLKTTSYEITTQTPVKLSCDKPSCSPGYRIVHKQSSYQSYKKNQYTKNYSKTNTKSKGSNFIKTKGHRKHPSIMEPMFHDQRMKHKDELTTEDTQCPEFICVPNPILPGKKKPEECPPAKCPPNYKLIYKKISIYKLQKCPKYVCEPIAPQEAVCNVTGRTFSTFDNMEYKYDICNHILARDMSYNRWYITLEKECDVYNKLCKKILVVTIHEDVIVFYPDLHMDVNEYTFTRSQIMSFGDRFSSFKVSCLGDKIILVSHYHKFWVLWDLNSNVKIGISTKLRGQLDGLCGYFDGNIMNDRQTPDGTQARSTVEFGNSWAMEGGLQCELHVCPRDIQEKAWSMCTSVKSSMLHACSEVVDIDRFVSCCVESTCSCLHNNSYEDCRCRLLTNFVTECEAANSNVDLSDWRTIHNCPASCPSPLVHKDCFRNKCETTCENLHEIDPCPLTQGICFSGCFCPDGTVRRNNECVQPVQCRDCTCDGLGNSKFIDFNRRDFKFDGNCTYLLSRNIVQNVKNSKEDHTYQILISNKNCAIGTCLETITLLYDKHIMQIIQKQHSKELQISIDYSIIEEFPYNKTWIILDKTSTGDLTLLIPFIQLEFISYRQNFAFTLKLPSHIFGDDTEGLCGNCNADTEDGFKKRDGLITNDTDDFGKSWLMNDLLTQLGLNNQTCSSNLQPRCSPPPSQEDTCRKLLDLTEFKQCHSIIDPKPYLDTCYDALCTGGSYCDSLEMYARKCLEAGLCPAWRTYEFCPYKCSEGLIYQPCASSCKETCDTLNESDKSQCVSSSIEGCFCPKDHVFHNDSCIPKQKCLVCDKDGHVEGDVWHPDKCTKCTCENLIVTCDRIECPVLDTICEQGMIPVLINATEEKCCPKYLCAPRPTVPTVCVEPQEPECGFGQIMKAIIDTDGCHKLMCQCLPANECPSFNEIMNETEELEIGFIKTLNSSGCCPRFTKICDPNTCPSAPDCSDYYNLITTTYSDKCCPVYECVPPKDICLYKMGTGNQSSEHIIAKQIGEEWRDGNCKTCVCDYSQDVLKSNCLITECPDIHMHPDINDYVLEEIILDDKCCPIFERTACKDGDKVYSVGDSWKPDIKNACITMQCDKYSGAIQKNVKIQECDTRCDYGYEYHPSNNVSINCCGVCIQNACVVEDMLKNIGEKWYSYDHCVTYVCESKNGTVYVQANTETCPEIDSLLELEYQIEEHKIPGKCCPEIIKTACRAEGKLYKPGEKWKSSTNSCITEMCLMNPNITKHKEVETCSRKCAQGWLYQEPHDDKCCGECKQAFCVIEDTLYEPSATWTSDDNCTIYTCMEQNEQLSTSISTVGCPDITDCPDNLIYSDQCCKRCNMTAFAQQRGDECTIDLVNANNTLGMFTINHSLHGKCKNLEAIEGLKECHGRCHSSTYFDYVNWNNANDCQCCQASQYTGIIVNLTCEDNTRLKKQIATPTSCFCQSCALSQVKKTNRKTKTRK